MYSVNDALAWGKRFRTLNVVDDVCTLRWIPRSTRTVWCACSSSSPKRERGMPQVLRPNSCLGSRVKHHPLGRTQRFGAAIHPAWQAQPERFHRMLQTHLLQKGPEPAPLRAFRMGARQYIGWMIDYSEIRPNDSLSGMSAVKCPTATLEALP